MSNARTPKEAKQQLLDELVTEMRAIRLPYWKEGDKKMLDIAREANREAFKRVAERNDLVIIPPTAAA